ncbi:MAG TPA: NADH-quinone oxidoreductase subunit J [Candidatus Sulfomarinibacteraceae bacterium]|nr:NADH-quinone oxidoreductase subunit J [Candidatus Sulfomarinibacteraceae bacterium]
MLNLFLVLLATVCAIQAIRSRRLIRAALYLAGVSAMTATLLYRLGAHEVAVIELSVGAGLVTVLFVFAIAIAGEDAMTAPPIVPRTLGLFLVLAIVAAAAWLVLPAGEGAVATEEAPFAVVLWQQRGLDALVQIGLIFAATLGVLGLLAEERAGDEAAAQQPETEEQLGLVSTNGSRSREPAPAVPGHEVSP